MPVMAILPNILLALHALKGTLQCSTVEKIGLTGMQCGMSDLIFING